MKYPLLIFIFILLALVFSINKPLSMVKCYGSSCDWDMRDATVDHDVEGPYRYTPDLVKCAVFWARKDNIGHSYSERKFDESFFFQDYDVLKSSKLERYYHDCVQGRLSFPSTSGEYGQPCIFDSDCKNSMKCNDDINYFYIEPASSRWVNYYISDTGEKQREDLFQRSQDVNCNSGSCGSFRVLWTDNSGNYRIEKKYEEVSLSIVKGNSLMACGVDVPSQTTQKCLTDSMCNGPTEIKKIVPAVVRQEISYRCSSGKTFTDAEWNSCTSINLGRSCAASYGCWAEEKNKIVSDVIVTPEQTITETISLFIDGVNRKCVQGYCVLASPVISVPICLDTSWSPSKDDICQNVEFTQYSNCGNTQKASGLKLCPISSSPDPISSFTQDISKIIKYYFEKISSLWR